MISVLSALVLAAASPGAPQSADPLEPARRGLMECQTPDVARKTCSALTRYAFEPDGRVIIQGDGVVNASPLIIMHERTLVFVKDGAICTALDDDPDVEFTMEGAPVDPATRAELREMVWTVLAELGTEFCTRHVRRGDELVSEMIIDGGARPDIDQPMLWVSPDDGWTVAP